MGTRCAEILPKFCSQTATIDAVSINDRQTFLSSSKSIANNMKDLKEPLFQAKSSLSNDECNRDDDFVSLQLMKKMNGSTSAFFHATSLGQCKIHQRLE